MQLSAGFWENAERGWKGLLVVRVKSARNIATSSQVLVRFRLSPWREEFQTSCANARRRVSETGEASWDDEVVELAHLATSLGGTHVVVPELHVDLRSRELYLLERAIGHATLDAAPFLQAPGVLSEVSMELETESDPVDIVLEVQFRPGVKTATLKRVSSTMNHARQHLFRLASYTRPTWCAVCGQMLVGLRLQGFECESCGLDCHSECQLRAHAVHACSRTTVEAAANRRAGAIAAGRPAPHARDDDDEAAPLVAPPDDDGAAAKCDAGVAAAASHFKAHPKTPKSSGGSASTSKTPSKTPKSASKSKTPKAGGRGDAAAPGAAVDTDVPPHVTQGSEPTSPATTRSSKRRRRKDGVGDIRLHLVSVRLLERTRASPSDDATEAADEDIEELRGDHYVRVAVAPSRHAPRPDRERSSNEVDVEDEASSKSWRRTHTVYQSSRPRFDCVWRLDVPTFAAEVRLELVDAARDTVIGTLHFGVLDVQQEAADDTVARFVAPWAGHGAATKAHAARRRPSHEGAARGAAPAPASAQYFADRENASFRDRHGVATAVARFAACDVDVYADELWFHSAPRDAPPTPAPSAFSIDIARRHIERATEITVAVSDALEAYDALMRWSRPAQTALCLMVFVALCVFFPAEKAGALPLLGLCICCAFSGVRRCRGAPRTDHFDVAARRAYELELGTPKTSFRPFGHVKVAVCAGRSLGGGEAKVSDLFVSVAYRNILQQNVDDDDESSKDEGEADATLGSATDGSDADDDDDAVDVAPAPPPGSPVRGPLNRETTMHTSIFGDDEVVDLLAALTQQRQAAETSTARSTAADRADREHFKEAQKEAKDTEAAKKARASTNEHILGYTGTARQTTEPRWHGKSFLGGPRALGASLWQRQRADLSRFVASKFVDSGDYRSVAVLEPWARFGFGETESQGPKVDRALVFPVLQPTLADSMHADDGGDASPKRPPKAAASPHKVAADSAPVSWRRSAGLLRFRVVRQHPLDRLLDSFVGEVCVPVAALVDHDGDGESGVQRERRGWYDVAMASDHDAAAPRPPGDDTRDVAATPRAGEAPTPTAMHLLATTVSTIKHTLAGDAPSSPAVADGNGKPRERPTAALNLRLQLTLRDAALPPTAAEAQTSRAVEALHQLAGRSGDEGGDEGGRRARGTVNPLATVTTVHGHAIYAQNVLGAIVDFYESLKNALSWTHPRKTLGIFGGCGAGACVFLCVPTRWLVLAGGLYEFFYRLLPCDGAPMSTRCWNLLRSLPNDDDLRCCYAYRAKAHADRAVRDERRRTALAKMHGIWECRWEGTVTIRVSSQQAWLRKFVVLHGRRLLWWRSEGDVDAGRAPGDQLLLHGHSGLTDPSPTDVAANKDHAELLLAVFGQTPDGSPTRWAILADDLDHKNSLAEAIQTAARSKLD
ncbi:hypothetical protein M885DRAFT_619701 [Pelagophyceae sp. CCMP2097]|nr:hypothetical protein M885DRAFT_619701 [Pelagophyceae sp. CCMP2097]